MAKRKPKPWTLADNLYQPKARKRVYHAPSSTYYEPSGRYGMCWNEMGEGLSKLAQYDPASMEVVRKTGGLKALIARMCPSLHPTRQAQLLERMESICHAKQRAQLQQHIKEHGGDSGQRRALMKLKRR